MLRSLTIYLAFCMLLAAATATAAADEPTFPYTAYITANDVYVRSGPGQTYYPTDKLAEGDEVEVYRHDPGGWYAIRPVEGSCSWVSGRYLTQGEDNLAVVNEERVSARVGSRFSDIRDVIQVRLHKGEVVELLDMKEVGSGSDRQTWYKIAPPSGEFRWVFGKYVDPDFKPTGLRRTAAADAPSDAEARYAEAPERATTYDEPTEPRTADRGRELPSLRARASGADRTADPEGDFRAETELTDTYDERYEPAVDRQMTPEQYREALRRLDRELAAMVAEEPTVWAFDDILLEAEELLHQAQTAVERGMAKVLLRKLDRFVAIQKHHRALASRRRDVDISRRRTAPAERLAGTLGAGLPGDGSFDGVGRLTPVVSKRLESPRYALMDDAGGVRCYVTPAAGVPLGHYLGQRVGVNGTRGYIPEERAYHIMAQHVSPLGGGRIR